MKKTLAILIGLALTTPSSAQETSTQGTGAMSGAEAWEKIYEVVSHPRCSNCHVGEDNRPRWSGKHYGLEDGEWSFHGMYVNGDDSRIGVESMMCATCHQKSNSPTLHGPPGSAVWALAPVEMEWFGKSSAEVCNQLKDPERNGGRSLDDVADHVDHDELVHWGWEPGPGREPAPYSRKDMVSFINAWAQAGAPCPD